MTGLAVVDFKEKIAEKIKTQFVDLIPEEMWVSLVDKTVRDFTEDSRERYNDKTIPSEARRIIKTQLEQSFGEAVAVRIGEYVAKQEVIDMVQEYIKTNAATIVADLLGKVVAQFVGQVSSEVVRGLFAHVSCPGCGRSAQRMTGSPPITCACGRSF